MKQDILDKQNVIDFLDYLSKGKNLALTDEQYMDMCGFDTYAEFKQAIGTLTKGGNIKALAKTGYKLVHKNEKASAGVPIGDVINEPASESSPVGASDNNLLNKVDSEFDALALHLERPKTLTIANYEVKNKVLSRTQALLELLAPSIAPSAVAIIDDIKEDLYLVNRAATK